MPGRRKGTGNGYPPDGPMSEHGTHDSLVWNALVRLPVPVEQRARQQLTEYLARVSAQQDRAWVPRPIAGRRPNSSKPRPEPDSVE